MKGVRNPRPGGCVMTVGEVAAAFGVSRRTVAKWQDAGSLPGFRVPMTTAAPRRAAERRFRTADVRAFARREGLPLGRVGLPAAVLVVAPLGSPLMGPLPWMPPDGGAGFPPRWVGDPWEAAQEVALLDVRGVVIDQAGLGCDLARVVLWHATSLPGRPPRLVLLAEDADPDAWACPGVTVLRGPCDPAAVAAWRAELAEGASHDRAC